MSVFLLFLGDEDKLKYWVFGKGSFFLCLLWWYLFLRILEVCCCWRNRGSQLRCVLLHFVLPPVASTVPSVRLCIHITSVIAREMVSTIEPRYTFRKWNTLCLWQLFPTPVKSESSWSRPRPTTDCGHAILRTTARKHNYRDDGPSHGFSDNLLNC